MSQLLANFSKTLSVMAQNFNCALDNDGKGCSFVISSSAFVKNPEEYAEFSEIARQFAGMLKSLSHTGNNLSIQFKNETFHLRKVSKQISGQNNEYLRFWLVKGVQIESGLSSKLLSMLSSSEEPAAEQVAEPAQDTTIEW